MFTIEDISEWVGDHDDERRMDGEMLVTSEGSIVIGVDFRPNPSRLSITFTDPDPTPDPCNPHLPDICAIAGVIMNNGFPAISIYWKTSTERNLVWSAYGKVFTRRGHH